MVNQSGNDVSTLKPPGVFFQEDHDMPQPYLAFAKEVRANIVTLYENQQKTDKDVEQIKSAFPQEDGNIDYAGHKRYHDYLIERSEERRKMRMAIQEKTISALVWSGVVWVALAAWHELLKAIGVAPK